MANYSLRVLAAAVAVLAISLGLMRMPYSHVAYGVEVFAAAAIALAAIVAIGSCQPARSFWLGFTVAAIFVLWNSYRDAETAPRLPRVARDAAAWVDQLLGWSTPPPKPGTTIYIDGDRIYYRGFDENGSPMRTSSRPAEHASAEELEKALPLPRSDAFESIFVHLSAVLLGLLGGWIAWSARRRTMRTGNAQPPAGRPPLP